MVRGVLPACWAKSGSVGRMFSGSLIGELLDAGGGVEHTGLSWISKNGIKIGLFLFKLDFENVKIGLLKFQRNWTKSDSVY